MSQNPHSKVGSLTNRILRINLTSTTNISTQHHIFLLKKPTWVCKCFSSSLPLQDKTRGY